MTEKQKTTAVIGHIDSGKRTLAAAIERMQSFVEETCLCGRVWRGTGSNPAADCPDCGEEMAREHKWRRDNHHP